MKKVNKKAILGFAMSMIFSLAIMQGISQKNVQQQDRNLQQVAWGCKYAATQTEGTTSEMLDFTATNTGGVFAGMVTVGLGSLYIAPTPVGLGYWVATAVVGL